MDDFKGKLLKLNKTCSLITIDDEAVILDTQKKCYYNLNETACFILKLIEKKQGITYEQLKQILISEYQINEEQAYSEIDKLLEKLYELGLLKIEEGKIPELNIKVCPKRKLWATPIFELEGEVLTVLGQATIRAAAVAKEPPGLVRRPR